MFIKKNVQRLITAISFVTVMLFATSCNDSPTPPEIDTSINIIAVTIPDNPLVVKQPVITEKEGRSEIVFYVASDTKESDMKFALTFEIPEVCTITPASETVVDFSQGTVIYSVVNTLAKLKKTYDVKCVREKYEDALITSILIDDSAFDKIVTQPELTNDGNYEFVVTAEATTEELKTLVPIIEISVGATISPESGVAQDFTSPVVYTVTSEDGKKSSNYTVTCIRKAYTTAEILSVSSADPLVEVQPVITGTSIKLAFSADATDAQVAASTLDCVISDGATLETSPLVVDTAVEYIVTAEDGVTKTIYSVTTERYRILYDFEQWSTVEGTKNIPSREDPNGWATANSGVSSIYMLGAAPLGPGYAGGYCVLPYENGVLGKGLEMITRDTKGTGLMAKKVPKITSGSVFLGEFITDMNDPLKSSKFGIKFDEGKPVKVRGHYKYKAGADYHKNKDGIDNTIKDEMAITVVLYEVDDYSETITAFENELNVSPKLIARAYMQSGEEKTEFTPFELVLEYGLNDKVYDPTKLYKFSVVFSSSFDGTSYYGAIDSSLIVDEVEVIYEK